MTELTQPLTIFEGPDGGGKTTAAKRYAELTGARYVHFGPLPLVKRGLVRVYVEAMLPALLGYQPVVMDRSWLSERPYGMVFRGGRLRVDATDVRMLERLAWRCGAVVVDCCAPLEACLVAFQSGRDEYLERDQQLAQVHALYRQMPTDLCVVEHNYTRDQSDGWDRRLASAIRQIRPLCHPLAVQSSGNLRARTVLVGPEFAELKDSDPWYQWSFASFNGQGCSRWVTAQLADAGITEDRLLWVNADQPLAELKQWLVDEHPTVVALGDGVAAKVQAQLGIEPLTTYHPQYWKRFHRGEPYPLLDLLKEPIT